MGDADDFKVMWLARAPNRCPHCGAEPCLPLRRKLSIWPFNSALCQACGLKVGLDPTPAMIVVLPIFVLIIAVLPLMALGDPVLSLIALILMVSSVVGFPVCVLFWVPLRPDELNWGRKVRESQERLAAQPSDIGSTSDQK
jgi:hypothetical protein